MSLRRIGETIVQPDFVRDPLRITTHHKPARKHACLVRMESGAADWLVAVTPEDARRIAQAWLDVAEAAS